RDRQDRRGRSARRRLHVPPRSGGRALVKMPDVGMYARAVPLLLRHPSILAMPLLAAAVDWGLTEISPFFTDALGGAGAGIFALIAQLVYGFAFGIAVIQASQAWRGRRASFDE